MGVLIRNNRRVLQQICGHSIILVVILPKAKLIHCGSQLVGEVLANIFLGVSAANTSKNLLIEKSDCAFHCRRTSLGDNEFLEIMKLLHVVDFRGITDPPEVFVWQY